MASILITGVTGFIGSCLVRTLQKQHDIFGIIRRPPCEHDPAGVRWIEQDLTKALEHSGLPKHVDAIIHLAQSKSYKQFPEGAKDIFDINVKSTFELLEFARKTGAENFVFASTGGVYGYSYEKFAETDPVNPLNFYLSSKHTAEMLIANYKQFFRTVVFRFFFVYGPGQKGRLIPTLVRKVLDGETIIINGNPGLRINPIYIEDALRVFESALHLRTSELFNVAGDENVTITDLLELIERISGKEAHINHTGIDPQGDLVGDNTRMKEVLNVHPQVTLLEGLSRMT